MYVLDTDHLGFLQMKEGAEYGFLRDRLAGVEADDIFVAIISFHEQIMGWNASLQRARRVAGVVQGYARMARVMEYFSTMQVLPFDAAAANEFENFRRQRIRVGAMDLRIAATALSRNYIVLTRNFADFEKVPGFQFEDWTIPLTNTDS